MTVKIWLHERPESLSAYERWVPAASEEGYGSLEKVREAAARAMGKSEPQTGWDEAGWVVSHEGLTVRLREANFWDDSDFFAVVWEDGKTREIQYGTTRCWTYNSSAKVDASPEVMEAFTAAETAARVAYAETLRALEAERLAGLPSKGKTVKVVKGRKIPKGTVAEVFWYGETAYGWRVGLEFEGKREFTAAHNVEVVTESQMEAAA